MRGMLSSSWLPAESYIHKRYCYYKQESNNKKSSIEINKHRFAHKFVLLSNHTADIKNSIARIISYVNNATFPGLFSGRKLGAIITTPIMPAQRFVQSPDNTLIKDGEKNFIPAILQNNIGLVNHYGGII